MGARKNHPKPESAEDISAIKELIRQRSTAKQYLDKQKQMGEAMSIDLDAVEREPTWWEEAWEDLVAFIMEPGYIIEIGLPVFLILCIACLCSYGLYLQWRNGFSKGMSYIGDGIDHHPERSNEL